MQSDAYAELAPDWDTLPLYVTWYAIDADGTGRYRDYEPYISYEERRWYGIAFSGHTKVNLPFGVDWRLCKWQRPQVQL